MMLRLSAETQSHRPDTLVVEEPLEIRLNDRPLAVTMRTPGHDIDLALGFLVSEGIIRSATDVVTARYCTDPSAARSSRTRATHAGRSPDGCDVTSRQQPDPTGHHIDNGGFDSGGVSYTERPNIVDVVLRPDVPHPTTDPSRHFYISSSCGLCGKASIDAVRTVSRFAIDTDPVIFPFETLAVLPDALRAEQKVFERTGGLHAAGLFTPDGALLCLREDVGRHNAVDKVIGWAVREGRLPLRGVALQVSGRASFELVQKAGMAGIPVLSAVSAPSTLAVDLARELGMTLAGFVREGRMNIYSGFERVPVPSRTPVRKSLG